MSITLLHAGLEDRPRLTDAGNEIVALGFIGIKDIMTPGALRVDHYQREILKSTTSLDMAIREGRALPAIMLGVRGSQSYKENGVDMSIDAPVYIIDGLQRVSALRRFAEAFPDRAKNITIGAEVRFGTTVNSEKLLFQILNSRRVAVSPNVLLRNMRDKYKSVLTLYGLSTNVADSPLFQRVQWGQRAGDGEIITAMMIVRAILKLYQHISTREMGAKRELHSKGGFASAGGVEKNALWMENKSRVVGLENFRADVLSLFEIIDEVWGFRRIEHNAPKVHLRMSFLLGFSMLLSEHVDFWRKNKLFVPAHLKERLKSFPFQREDIAMMVRGAAGSGSGVAFCDLLIRHINRGKSTRKLKARDILIQD